jgi:hypothetical protein
MKQQVQLDKIASMSTNTYEVSPNSTYVDDNVKFYRNPYENQQTYCQRSFGKPMAKEVVPVAGHNLYEKRPVTEDDLTMTLKNYSDVGMDEVQKWPGSDVEGYRHNLNEGYQGGRTAAGAFDNILPEKNYISTYTKSKYLDTGRKNGGKPITAEGYISYPMENGDQENIWSSASTKISTTLPEALSENFTFLGKEYNCLDVIEIIIIVILLIVFGMLIYAKVSKDKCIFKGNKYLHWFYDVVN